MERKNFIKGLIGFSFAFSPLKTLIEVLPQSDIIFSADKVPTSNILTLSLTNLTDNDLRDISIVGGNFISGGASYPYYKYNNQKANIFISKNAAFDQFINHLNHSTAIIKQVIMESENAESRYAPLYVEAWDRVGNKARMPLLAFLNPSQQGNLFVYNRRFSLNMFSQLQLTYLRSNSNIKISLIPEDNLDEIHKARAISENMKPMGLQDQA